MHIFFKNTSSLTFREYLILHFILFRIKIIFKVVFFRSHQIIFLEKSTFFKNLNYFEDFLRHTDVSKFFSLN